MQRFLPIVFINVEYYTEIIYFSVFYDDVFSDIVILAMQLLKLLPIFNRFYTCSSFVSTKLNILFN